MTIRSVFTWSYSLPSLAVFFQIFHLRRLPLLRIANYSCYSLAHILTILSHIAHSCNYSTCVRLRLSISKRWLVCLSTHRGGNTIGKACRVSVATRWRALSHVLRLERAHDLRMGVGVCTRRAGVCYLFTRAVRFQRGGGGGVYEFERVPADTVAQAVERVSVERVERVEYMCACYATLCKRVIIFTPTLAQGVAKCAFCSCA